MAIPNPTARGDTTGILMPTTPQELAANAAAFLTDAMRAYGSLPQEGRVITILRCEETHGGNSGKKMLLDVAYEGASADLPTRLFAKFSRDFDDAFRDRRRDELDGEIRLAALSRHPAFPVEVPQPVFADFERASGTGLLITERIAFGEGKIEPLRPKCMDHLLPDAIGHYHALVSAQARLAAAHQSGRLSPQVEALFPYDRAAAEADLPISCGADELAAKVAIWCDFIVAHPQLFPPALALPEWRSRFLAEALAIHARQQDVRRFLQADPRFVALCHWNTNVDNAWFWRGPEGAWECGLLDWGMVRVMNVTTGLWGGLSAANTQFLGQEVDAILAYYAKELAAHDGAQIASSELGTHFDLSLAITGLALMMDLPALVTARCPRIGEATGPLDPLLSDGVVQGFLLVSTNFLNLWQRRDFAASLARIA